MTLEQILANSKDFGDDLEIPFGTEKVKLSDLRNLTRSERKALSDQMEELKADKQRTLELAQKAAELMNSLDKEKQELSSRNHQPAGSDDFDSAEWWKPVRERLGAREKAEKELMDKVEKISTAFSNALTIFAEDRWQSQFDKGASRLHKNDKYKDWNYEKVRDYAVAQKLLDRHGLPSVEKAIAALTQEDETEQKIREALERGRKEGEQRARMAAIARPSSASGTAAGSKGPRSLDPNNNLNDLSDVVADDPDLVKMLADLGALGPGDIQ